MDDGFSNWGFDFFFEKVKNIWTLRTNFSKANKEQTLGISFFKGCRQKFEGTDSSHLWRGGGGGAGKKKERPNGSLCPNQTDTSAMIRHLKHESNAIEFESKAYPLKFYLLVQF